MKKWIVKKTLTSDEVASIISAFGVEGKKLRIPETERAKMATEIKALLEKDPNVLLKK